MLPPKKTRDLARSLVAREGEASLRIQPTTVRAYERLRLQLGTLMGVDGFHAVASRALALAKSHSPRLNAVQVTADGGLLGLDAVGGGEAGIVLIAQLLGLFLTFLGEATTLRLIEDLHLQVTAAPEPATIGADPAGLAAEGPAAAAAFSDLLLEIDRLRIAGDNIETLAAKYPGMEEGLVSLASNIQSIATVLDVFTLIKSKAGERLNDAPLPQMNGYVH
jgi:hypothetical protein